MLNDPSFVDFEVSISLTFDATPKKPANFFDDAYELFLWIKVNVFQYMIGMNVSEQNSTKATAVGQNSY